VLAVLVIVSAMVVSFTAMTSNSRRISEARLEALQDIRVAEAIVENFIEGNKITTVFEKDESGNTLVKNKLEAGENSLVFNEAYKTLTVSGGTKYTLERVKSITFDYYGDGAEKIYYCTITYMVGNQEYNYTFCVISYASGTQEVTNEG
jgi:flagellar basal body-associated protein FliL